jgi:hypothetical protein
MSIKFVLGPLHQLVLRFTDMNEEGAKLLCQIVINGDVYLAEYEKRSASHYTWTGVTHQTGWQTMVGVGGGLN